MDKAKLLELSEVAVSLASSVPDKGSHPTDWMSKVRALRGAYHNGDNIDNRLRDLMSFDELHKLEGASSRIGKLSASYSHDKRSEAVLSLTTISNILKSAAEKLNQQPKAEHSEISDESKFGDWQKIRPLKPGGQGDVFLVKRISSSDSSAHELGVLKLLKERLKDPKAKKRLEHEIKILRDCSHPLIVRVLDSSESTENPFIVTEFAPLGSLSENLELFNGDAWRSLRIARDIAVALDFIHSKGVVHRDVKPRNIFLRTTGDALLGDFGIAHNPALTSITGTHEKVGPQWFAPPEADEGKIEPTPAFDVYSLGKLIYFLLVGNRFSREQFLLPQYNLVEVLKRPDLEPINELLKKMICEQPEERMESMQKVIREIDNTIVAVLNGLKADQFKCSQCQKGYYAETGAITYHSAFSIWVNVKGHEPQDLRQFEPTLLVCSNCGGARITFKKANSLLALIPKMNE